MRQLQEQYEERVGAKHSTEKITWGDDFRVIPFTYAKKLKEYRPYKRLRTSSTLFSMNESKSVPISATFWAGMNPPAIVL